MSEKPRAAAYEETSERFFQWYFRAIPDTIRFKGYDIPNPFRQHAFYVVHGMGEQLYTDTAAALRMGFEDTVPLVDPGYWEPGAPNYWIVPQPFAYDGYWGDYESLEQFAPLFWNRFTERERAFFSRVWHGRAISFKGTWSWFRRSGRRLIWKAPWPAKLYYLWLMPQLSVGILLLGLSPKTRKVVTGYLNDVRLFVEPRGDMEHYIAQRIEHVVGSRFLQLLGLDWNFQPLLPCYQVNISGRPHSFKRVTWVAHSLGSVVSYKVIGDILRRCLAKRSAYPASTAPPDVLRVEQGLAAFVTMGSPLDKIRYLYPESELVQDWPSEYLPDGSQSLWGRSGYPPRFWHNFHYTSDPVSGHLDAFTCLDQQGIRQSVVENFHPQGAKAIGFAHIAYWRDTRLLARVLRISFEDYVAPWPPAEQPRPGWVQFCLRLLAFASYGVLVPLALITAVWYVWSRIKAGLE